MLARATMASIYTASVCRRATAKNHNNMYGEPPVEFANQDLWRMVLSVLRDKLRG